MEKMEKFVFRELFDNEDAWKKRSEPVDVRQWPKEEKDLHLAQQRVKQEAVVTIDCLQRPTRCIP